MAGVACGLLSLTATAAFAEDAPTQSEPEFEQQSEAEFQKQMPITGTVETFFGEFKLDHSFPEEGEADRIYEIIDHQRASQLYLWGLPIVAMTRWHQGYKDALEDYD